MGICRVLISRKQLKNMERIKFINGVEVMMCDHLMVRAWRCASDELFLSSKSKYIMIPMFHIKVRNTVRRSFSTWGLLLSNILMLRIIYLQIEPLLLSGKHVMVVAHANSLRSMIMYLDELSSEEVKNEIHKFQAKCFHIHTLYL